MAPVATKFTAPEPVIQGTVKGQAGLVKMDKKSQVEMKTQAAGFCQRVYKSGSSSTKLESSGSNPRVTLTYAQSSDGKISGPNKEMVALSGEESMIMTHTLRKIHDAILIGVGTLLSDDPQLNTRLIQNISASAVDALPRPIILDSSLRMPLHCKLLTNARNGIGRSPLVIAAIGCDRDNSEALSKAGAQIELIEPKDGLLSWKDILKVLEREGIRSVMIEGGANVIESLFQADEEEHLINELVITVAPIALGEDATGYKKPTWLQKELSLSQNGFHHKENTGLTAIDGSPEVFGKDLVYAWSRSEFDLKDK